MTYLEYGLTKIKQGSTWKPVKSLWQKDSTGNWVPVQTAWVKRADGNWERIFPTPAGINTATPTSISLEVYQNFSTSTPISFTNTGDRPLTIANVIAYDGTKTVTSIDFTGMGGGYPYTIAPGSSGYINISVLGNTVGTSSGNITFVNDTGYFGNDGNVAYWPGNQTVVPVTTTVLPNYSACSVSPNPIVYNYFQQDTPASISVAITNIGNGANLHISSITTTGNGTISSLTSSTVTTGNSAHFTLTANALTAGSYTDTITVYSDAKNGNVTIPVALTVAVPHATQVFDSPGTYTWTVPAGVYSLTAAVVGAGGGGSGSSEVGNGAGGGAGGSGGVALQSVSVTPGETLSITVGAGGAGAPFVGRNPGAVGAEGPGGNGATSSLTGSFGTINATGGSGGGAGLGYPVCLGGAGGPAGNPSGVNGTAGTTGTNDYSTTYGGIGGNNGFVYNSVPPTGLPYDQIAIVPGSPDNIYGRGGNGASAPDRVPPYNWPGYPGAAGAVLLSW